MSGTDGKGGKDLARCPEKQLCLLLLKVHAGHSSTGLLQRCVTTEATGKKPKKSLDLGSRWKFLASFEQLKNKLFLLLLERNIRKCKMHMLW